MPGKPAKRAVQDLRETVITTEKDETGLPRERLWQPTTAKWFFTIFGLAIAYAVIRYHLVQRRRSLDPPCATRTAGLRPPPWTFWRS